MEFNFIWQFVTVLYLDKASKINYINKIPVKFKTLAKNDRSRHLLILNRKRNRKYSTSFRLLWVKWTNTSSVCNTLHNAEYTRIQLEIPKNSQTPNSKELQISKNYNLKFQRTTTKPYPHVDLIQAHFTSHTRGATPTIHDLVYNALKIGPTTMCTTNTNKQIVTPLLYNPSMLCTLQIPASRLRMKQHEYWC